MDKLGGSGPLNYKHGIVLASFLECWDKFSWDKYFAIIWLVNLLLVTHLYNCSNFVDSMERVLELDHLYQKKKKKKEVYSVLAKVNPLVDQFFFF